MQHSLYYSIQIGTIGDRFKSVPGYPTELLGNNSVLDPPDPIPNSEVKRNCADDSVGSPHVKVGHCQALIRKPRSTATGLFSFWHSSGDYYDKYICWNMNTRQKQIMGKCRAGGEYPANAIDSRRPLFSPRPDRPNPRFRTASNPPPRWPGACRGGPAVCR